ncbi:hypothetical protein INT81_09660 [Riemerella anatipestifer]|nr:hypothetical protein [Riemerella anatipestifer]
MQKSQSAISTFVQDSFSGIRVIKFFNKEKYIQQNYNTKVKTLSRKSSRPRQKQKPIFHNNTISHWLTQYYYSIHWGTKIHKVEMSIGAIADFFMYINILIWPFSMVGWVTSANQRAAASMQRLNEFLTKI